MIINQLKIVKEYYCFVLIATTIQSTLLALRSSQEGAVDNAIIMWLLHYTDGVGDSHPRCMLNYYPVNICILYEEANICQERVGGFCNQTYRCQCQRGR